MKAKTKLLIVVDDPQLLRAQAALLEEAGYHVIRATTGQEALRLAREVRPDVALLDVALPDAGGVDICRRIKGDPALAQTFVVLLSDTTAGPNQPAEGLEAGADGTITRPIADRELLARVEALLRIQRVEQELRASEARYRDVFENAPIGIYRTTPDGQILMANPALVDMLGYDSFQDLAQRDLESNGYYHPDYPRAEFKRRMGEGAVKGLESAWQRKDGSTLFVRENAQPVYDDHGELVAYQGTVEDVTERVLRTERLKRLNTVLDAISEVNQLIVRERDRDRLIGGACQRLVETRGYSTAWIALWGDDGELLHSAEAGLGDRFSAIVEALEDHRPDLCGMEALSQPGVWVASGAKECPLADVYGEDRLMAIRLEHAGMMHGLMTVSLPPTLAIDERERALFEELAGDIAFALHDIRLEEERRKVDRALQRSQRRQSLILSAITEHCIYHSTELEIQWANRAAADSVGLPQEELVGRHCYEVWAEREEPCPDCPVLKALKTGEPHETEQVTPDGRVWFVRGYPVFDEGPDGRGEIEGLVEFTQDITEAKTAERARRESEARYRVLFESTGTATGVFGDDGVIRVCNDKFPLLAGLPKEEIEGRMRWWDFVAEEDLERMRRYHAQRNAGTGNPPTEYPCTFVDAQGQEREIYVQLGMLPETKERVVSLTDVTPLKRAEKALRESEERYRTLFESSPDAIALLDLEGTVLDCNPATAEIAGSPREELIGRPFMELGVLEADDLPRYAEVFARLLDGEPMQPLKLRTRRGDGETRWLEAFPVPITREGAVHAIQVIARDITERKLAEEARERLLAQQLAVNALALALGERQEIEELYHIVYQHVLELMDADTFVISFYQRERDMLQASYAVREGDVIDVSSLAPVALDEGGHSAQSRVIRRGKPFYTPYLGGTEPGTEPPQAVRGHGRVLQRSLFAQEEESATQSALYVPMRFEGQTVGVMQVQSCRRDAYSEEDRDTLAGLANVAAVAIQNVRLLERTRRQARRLQQTIDTVPEGVLLLDAERRVILCNPVAERDLDVLAQARVGERLAHLGGCPMETILTPPPMGRAWHEVEADDRTFEIIGRPMTSDREPDHWVLVIHEVTDEREIQEQLRQHERLAAVGRLAGGIAHDFNNLLASIILCAQMPLRGCDLTPATEDALQTILQESYRAADLIQQILDFSRSAMMETEPLDLVALVRETMMLLRRTIPEDIRLTMEMTPHPCTIQADATRIHQVLMNLALNAKDAMPEGGELRIQVEPITIAPEDEAGSASHAGLPDMPRGAWARLTVSDTGTGMSERALDHLFEPFFTTKQEGQGTGLGLPQVYGIIKQHQGFIDVQTAEDEGTTFTIFLPLVAPPQAEGASEEEAAPPQGRGETVLVVEDAERLRAAIQAGLEAFSYRVLTAANGREALEVLSQHHVDLVLTDVVMPHMGGEALLHNLRARDAQLKVVAVTGHVMDTDVEELRAAGFSDALPKPFSIDRLNQVVRDVLDE